MDSIKYIWEDEVTSYLATHPRVTLAFLFGSFAKDKCRADSDVDLAVHLLAPYSEQDVASIWDRVEDITHRDVDLVVLNTAPPGIAWTSMKGEVLVDKDPKLHLELMLDRSREAEDFREFVTAFLDERRRRWGDGSGHPITLQVESIMRPLDLLRLEVGDIANFKPSNPCMIRKPKGSRPGQKGADPSLDYGPDRQQPQQLVSHVE